MPKSFYLLSLLAIYGCVTVQSTQKKLNSGNYDQAIEDALKELRPNKSHPKAQPYVFLLQEAFIKAQQREENLLTNTSLHNSLHVLENQIRTLEKLTQRQELLRPILPLTDLKTGKEIVFPLKDYTATYNKTLTDFAATLEETVRAGIAQNSGPYFFRDYFEKFAFLERRYSLNARQQKLYQDCRNYGTTAAYGVLVNNSRNVLPKSVANCLLHFNNKKALSFWTPYDAVQRNTTDYAIEIQINLVLMEVSPEDTKQQLLQFEEEVEDGTTPLRNTKGKIVLDSLGEVIEVPKFKTVKATYYKNAQQKSAHLKAEIELINLKTQNQIGAFPLEAHWEFLHEYGSYSGDQQTLEKELIQLLELKKIDFPSNVEMLHQVCNDLGKQLYERLRNFDL